MHLMIDQYECDNKLMDDPKYIYHSLEELTKLLKMKPLTKPQVVKAESNSKRDPGGWSGYIIIQESHISIHTFIDKGFLTADVYSCKPFDVKKGIKYFQKRFKSKNLEINEVVRGINYPD